MSNQDLADHHKAAQQATLVEHEHQRFLIMDSPSDANIQAYIEMLKKKNVTCVVRACESTYSPEPMVKAGIRVVELPFADGGPPPSDVVDLWLETIESELPKKPSKNEEHKAPAIAVHCLAGLGRSAVLVAIALVELGMEAYDAIAYIRKRRRGAINQKQLVYIEGYKKKQATGCCEIM